MSAAKRSAPSRARPQQNQVAQQAAERTNLATCVSRSKLETILSRTLAERWRKNWPTNIFLGDDEYYVPPLDEALATIQKSRPLFHKWTDQLFDCDDFAFVLKGHFCRAATHHRRRRYGYCFGIVWKTKPVEHAMNWIVYRERDPAKKKGQRFVFGLVEPQWFRNPTKLKPIRPVAANDGGFYFVTA